MRPGFYIPECLAGRRQGAGRSAGFNEAGILHPGMLAPSGFSRRIMAGFNEAGILHPGMPRR